MKRTTAKEKQDAKAMYSILGNSKTVWFLVNTNLAIAKQFGPWSTPITTRLTRTKVEHNEILSRAYSTNKKNFKLYGPFLWMGFNCLKARATSRKQFTFYH